MGFANGAWKMSSRQPGVTGRLKACIEILVLIEG
jgi:hypothetical protein